jgi:putative membrane protein
MKRAFFGISIVSLAALAMAACGDTTVNVNTSRMANTAGNAANSVANTAANAANTVANAVTKATATGPDEFVEDAAHGGMAEVELGKLATSKAKDAEVKKFGQMMVTDHTKANNELKTLAQTKKWTLPTDAGPHKDTIEELGKLSGEEFDRAYVDQMVEDHEADVEAFEEQAQSSADAELKAFAAKTLPTLKEHLETIKAIQARLNK